MKWAETADGFIASSSQTALQRRGAYEDPGKGRLFISNEYTNRLVHKWRSEEAAILVGTNTIVNDDPELTTRLWPGRSPVRLIIDMHLRLPLFLKVFDRTTKTIVFNGLKHEENENLLYYQVTEDVSLVDQIVNGLHRLNIQSVIVEGGAKLLQSFIDKDMWDETRIIRNGQLVIGKGLPAPELKNVFLKDEQDIFSDTIKIYKQQNKLR